MKLFLLTACGVFFGYALGYALAFKEFEAERNRLSAAVKFWQDICARQRKQIADTIKWNIPPNPPESNA